MTWFIAITNPNCHRRAECELAALGYRAFWPKMRKWVSHARRKVPKEYPILGRYMFVDVLPNENGEYDFWQVREVNGIEALVTGTNVEGFPEPLPIPRKIIADFEVRYHAGEWDFVTNNAIPVGARIQVLEGEFARTLQIVRGRKNGKLQFLPPGEHKLVSIREEKAWAA